MFPGAPGPPRDALLDAMETLFDLLAREPEAAVRAVLDHHLFVFIHPYFDGNGRIGRFLMNAMLASGGYARVLRRHPVQLNRAAARYGPSASALQRFGGITGSSR